MLLITTRIAGPPAPKAASNCAVNNNPAQKITSGFVPSITIAPPGQWHPLAQEKMCGLFQQGHAEPRGDKQGRSQKTRIRNVRRITTHPGGLQL